MAELRTSAPRRERGTDTRVIVDVDGQQPLWFSVAHEHAELLSDRADHVALALLMPAMKAGRDLHIGGVVTDVLLHQINADLQPLLQAIHPEFTTVRVDAEDLAPARLPRPGVGTGFSGGVDSLAAVRTYFLDEGVPEALRLTHLVNYNVGSHGTDGRRLWNARCAPLAEAAAAWALPFVRVDSNLDAHYPQIGFLESVSMRNAAAAHALTGGLGRMHVASAKQWAFAGVDSGGDIARADAMLLPAVSTPALTLSSANSGMTRVEKTLALVGRPEARYLDVCVSFDANGRRNCGECDKCLRAVATFEIAGHLHDVVPRIFPAEPYARRRAAFLAGVLASDDPFALEMRTLARARGWRWGVPIRTRAVIERARRGGDVNLRRAARTRPGMALRRMLRG